MPCKNITVSKDITNKGSLKNFFPRLYRQKSKDDFNSL